MAVQLKRELDKCRTSNTLKELNIVCEPASDESLHVWDVSFLAEGFKHFYPSFYQSLMKHPKTKRVLLRIHFNRDDYKKPPLARVVRPKFQYHTGHVTIGGNICSEVLTNEQWHSVESFENLFLQIRNLFKEGEGCIALKQELHVRFPFDDYNFQEALNGLSRMERTHGWNLNSSFNEFIQGDIPSFGPLDYPDEVQGDEREEGEPQRIVTVPQRATNSNFRDRDYLDQIFAERKATLDSGLEPLCIKEARESIHSFLECHFIEEGYTLIECNVNEYISFLENMPPGSPVGRLLQALAENSGTTCKAELFFHGTPRVNIDSILRDGLDPMLRRGQAQGPGEYFTKRPSVAEKYCRGGDEMIIFACVIPSDGRGITCIDSNVAVINDHRLHIPLFKLKFAPSSTNRRRLTPSAVNTRQSMMNSPFQLPVRRRAFSPAPLNPRNVRPRLSYIVYHLELHDDKHYVGMTSKTLIERRDEHIDRSSGAQWTALHGATTHIQQVGGPYDDVKDAKDMEDNETIRLMDIYGVDNVRGGIYASVELSATVRTEISGSIGRLRRRNRQDNVRPRLSNLAQAIGASSSIRQIERHPPSFRDRDYLDSAAWFLDMSQQDRDKLRNMVADAIDHYAPTVHDLESLLSEIKADIVTKFNMPSELIDGYIRRKIGMPPLESRDLSASPEDLRTPQMNAPAVQGSYSAASCLNGSISMSNQDVPSRLVVDAHLSEHVGGFGREMVMREEDIKAVEEFQRAEVRDPDVPISMSSEQQYGAIMQTAREIRKSQPVVTQACNTSSPIRQIERHPVSPLESHDLSASPEDPRNVRPRLSYIVYHLSLREGKHYVGMTTKSLEDRYKQHSKGDGEGAEWTREYPPYDKEQIGGPYNDKNTALSMENAETVKLMGVHGIDNVRGGSYANRVLDDTQIASINGQIQVEANLAQAIGASSSISPRLSYIVYHLELRDDKHYIGMTSETLGLRLFQHIDRSSGVQWTALHGATTHIQQVGGPYDTEKDAKDMEDNETIRLMDIYGVDNVRGGIYASVELSATVRTEIEECIGRLRRRNRQDNYSNSNPSKTVEDIRTEEEALNCESYWAEVRRGIS